MNIKLTDRQTKAVTIFLASFGFDLLALVFTLNTVLKNTNISLFSLQGAILTTFFFIMAIFNTRSAMKRLDRQE